MTALGETIIASLSSGWSVGFFAVLNVALICAVVYLLFRNRRLQRLAALDALTGLFSRLLLNEILDRELARAARHHTPLCVAMIDLDHFKRVNDRFGHLEGDRVLVAIAGLLRNGTRASDVVGRWGGEEFLVILPDTGLAESRFVVERLRHELAGVSLPKVGTVTVSTGVAELLPGETRDMLVGRADKALYQAKVGGRNRTGVAEGINGPAAN